MKSFRFVLLPLLLLLTTASVFAQRAERQDRERDPEARAERMAERLTIVLELSDEQSEEVEAFAISHAEKVHDLREKHREAAREEMKALEEERRAAMKSILTEEQFVKLEALEARHTKGRERRGPRRGGRG
jgi:hypothetical protein